MLEIVSTGGDLVCPRRTLRRAWGSPGLETTVAAEDPHITNVSSALLAMYGSVVVAHATVPERNRAMTMICKQTDRRGVEVSMPLAARVDPEIQA